MTNFIFTDFVEPNSSAVDGLYFNDIEGFLVIDWNDELYRYDDVPQERYNSLVCSPSVGTAAQKIKMEFGPGVHLGNFNDVGMTFEQDDTVSDDTQEFSLNTPYTDNVVDISVNDTKEYSLNTPGLHSVVDKALDSARKIKVHFVINGVKGKYVANSEDLDEALFELDQHLDSLSLKADVTKVVVTFD